jgi:hypothetical protein
VLSADFNSAGPDASLYLEVAGAMYGLEPQRLTLRVRTISRTLRHSEVAEVEVEDVSDGPILSHLRIVAIEHQSAGWVIAVVLARKATEVPIHVTRPTAVQRQLSP